MIVAGAAVWISFLLLRNVNLFEKQQVSRFASPAHLTEFAKGMLERIHVNEAVRHHPVTRIPESTPFGELVKTVTRSGETHFPVVDRDGKMTGIVSMGKMNPEKKTDGRISAMEICSACMWFCASVEMSSPTLNSVNT